MTEDVENSQEVRKVGKKYPYDAIVILGGGLQKTGDKFYPTDYRHSDQFGILGAGMRMVAAVELYIDKQASNFIFSTGVTEKNKEKYGDEVPRESSVYSEKFLRILKGLRKRFDYKDRFKNLDVPTVLQEDKSYNTSTNVQEILGMIREFDWHKIAIISNDYHIPRIKEWYEIALKQNPDLKCQINYIPAEDYIKKENPGKYDSVIKEYKNTDDFKKREAYEEQGTKALGEGKIITAEFQLKDNK